MQRVCSQYGHGTAGSSIGKIRRLCRQWNRQHRWTDISNLESQAPAEARRIESRGEADSLGILAEGQSNAMRIIAGAQAEARQILVSPEAIVHGEIDFGETVNQRIRFQEEKRQRNIEAVVTKAALQLGNEEAQVQDHEPDHDWTSRFFNDIQDVSNEETQQIYAKILAGEVERPGQTSVKTLSILRDLDQSTASLFRTLCSVTICLDPRQEWMSDARVVWLTEDIGWNGLSEYGLSFRRLTILNEHGLIISSYTTTCNYDASVGFELPPPDNRCFRIPFGFQNYSWALEPTEGPLPAHQDSLEPVHVAGVALTKAGRELYQVVDQEPMDQYFQELQKYFEAKNLRMVEVEPTYILQQLASATSSANKSMYKTPKAGTTIGY